LVGGLEMDKAWYLVQAHLVEGVPVAELAAAHGVHRSWIYKMLARYRAEGRAGLEPRSRRPKTTPGSIAAELEDEIVRLRKQLGEEGLDAGAATIHWHLQRRHGDQVPSTSTIWRVLKRRGFITPQPRKRPAASLTRFEADLPNETWQSDMTHWTLAHGTGVEIVNFLDDHSRYCIASVVVPVAKATDVVTIFTNARQQHGLPASVLTDNGAIYTARYCNGITAFESELATHGIVHKHAAPYHPQTCGKVERFHQTLKKFLNAQPDADTIATLQTDIDRFVAHYNHHRPHRSLGRQTPAQAYNARIKAAPNPTTTASRYRTRHDHVDQFGRVTLRYRGRLHHIGIGRPQKGTPITLLTRDRDIRIINRDTGELLRHLTLNPNRDYQPQNAKGD
jgi:transposase InsO family protein